MKAFYHADSHVGKVRTNNEDAFLLEEVWNKTHLLAVVVDGVGGYRGGDVAARLACRCIGEHIANSGGNVDSADILQAAVVYANNSICSQHCNPLLSQMSCVMTAVLINLKTGKTDVCHIGDTRLYMLKDEQFVKITSDHSLVGPMEESGKLSEQQAMTHPRRNIITRSVGQKMLYPGTDYIQTHTIGLKPCTLMLCSDGLYDMVHSSETVRILKEKVSVNTRVEALVAAALNAGGKDNVTVIVIDLMQDYES